MSTPVAPCVVRLLRNKQKVIQDCDVYIGTEKRNAGWQLMASKWSKSHSRHTPEMYESDLRANSSLMSALHELTGQVLGCFCAKPVQCHGQILIKVWKEQFPQHTIDADLGKKHYHAKEKIAAKRKPSEAGPAPQRAAPKLLYRDQTTHPDGLRGDGSLHPWPSLDDREFRGAINIDEAGRGSWAGPMHIGGTVLLPGFNLLGLHDSKLLKEHEREKAYEALLADQEHAICHVEVVSVDEIDERSLGQAWKEGIRRLAATLHAKASARGIVVDRVLLDGNQFVSDTVVPVRAVTKGDQLYAGISAGSILAKVSRDRFMTSISPQYPQFQEIFSKGHGYRFDKRHDELIAARTFTPLHRKSFNPLKSVLAKKVVVVARKPGLSPTLRSSDQVGFTLPRETKLVSLPSLTECPR